MTDDGTTESLGDTTSSIESLTRETFAELSGDTPPPSPEPPDASATEAPSRAGTETSTVAPVAATGDEKPAGPIPLKAHKDILERERAKRAPLEQEVQQLRQREQQYREVEEFRQRFEADPGAYWTEIGDKLSAHPDGRKFLQSQAAKWLRAGRASEPSSDEMPAADLQDSQGHGVYSETQMAKLLEWQRSQLMGHVQETIAPITRRHAQETQLAQARDLAQKTSAQATSILTEWRTKPGWTEKTEPAIKARFKEYRQAGHNEHLALAWAYTDVVVPTLGQQERAAMVESLQSKTAATTVAPGRSLTAKAKPGSRSVHETARDVARDVLAASGMLTGT